MARWTEPCGCTGSYYVRFVHVPTTRHHDRNVIGYRGLRVFLDRWLVRGGWTICPQHRRS